MKSIWWKSTSIIHAGYRVEWEVKYDPETKTQEYTGKSRYVPVQMMIVFISEAMLLWEQFVFETEKKKQEKEKCFVNIVMSQRIKVCWVL